MSVISKILGLDLGFDEDVDFSTYQSSAATLPRSIGGVRVPVETANLALAFVRDFFEQAKSEVWVAGLMSMSAQTLYAHRVHLRRLITRDMTPQKLLDELLAFSASFFVKGECEPPYDSAGGGVREFLITRDGEETFDPRETFDHLVWAGITTTVAITLIFYPYAIRNMNARQRDNSLFLSEIRITASRVVQYAGGLVLTSPFIFAKNIWSASGILTNPEKALSNSPWIDRVIEFASRSEIQWLNEHMQNLRNIAVAARETRCDQLREEENKKAQDEERIEELESQVRELGSQVQRLRIRGQSQDFLVLGSLAWATFWGRPPNPSSLTTSTPPLLPASASASNAANSVAYGGEESGRRINDDFDFDDFKTYVEALSDYLIR